MKTFLEKLQQEIDSSIFSCKENDVVMVYNKKDDRLPADYLINGSVFREIKGSCQVDNATAGSIYNEDTTINYDVLNAILIGFQVRGWSKDEVAEREKLIAAELENQGGGITINP